MPDYDMMAEQNMMSEVPLPQQDSLIQEDGKSPLIPNDVFPIQNLASILPEEVLKKIGRVVVEDYKEDKQSQSEWDKMVVKWHKLFSANLDPKDFPWKNCSNVNIPIISTACFQSQARSYEALLPSKEIAKCYSTDGKTIEAAERAQKCLNWQLSDNMDEWKEDMDVLLLLLPKCGSGVKKTYFDNTLNRPVSRTLRVDEFVAPYGCKRLEDAPRKTHCLEVSLNDIKIKGRDGIWINTDKIKDIEGSAISDKPATEYRDSSDKTSGSSKGTKNKPRLILEQHRLLDLSDSGDIEEQYMVTVDYETETVLNIEPLSYIDILTGKKKVFEHFTAYSFFPNPDSWRGLGFGHILQHLNEAINSLTNQLNDAGTLANTSGGFVNSRSTLRAGNLSFSMGQFKLIDASVDDLNKAIYKFQFNPPSQVLFELLSMLQNYARDLSSVSESMLGKLPPSDTTATTMLSVMEQGLKVFSSIHKRIHSSFAKELKKIALLNSFYLDDNVYFMVQDSTSSSMVGYTSGREDFANNIDVIPSSDPTITSRAEKLIRTKQAYELGMSSPLIAENKESMYELLKSYYEAIEVQNIDKILKKPEEEVPPDLRPEQEEAEFLAERNVQPLPEQDHEAHLISHQNFKDSPQWSEKLTPQGKKLLDGHIRETIALLYIKMSGGGKEENGLPNEMYPVGVQGMAEPSMYEGVPNDIGDEQTGTNDGNSM